MPIASLSGLSSPASRQRERETKQRRAARASSRGIGIGSGADVERAFLLGLVDACPRCGESLEGYPDEAEQRRHLMECTDTRKHAQHRKEQGKLAAKAAAKEAKRDAQDSAQVRRWSERRETSTFVAPRNNQSWQGIFCFHCIPTHIIRMKTETVCTFLENPIDIRVSHPDHLL